MTKMNDGIKMTVLSGWLVLISVNASFGQIYWDKTFSQMFSPAFAYSAQENATAITNTPDSNCLVVGNGGFGISVIKMKSDGSILWVKSSSSHSYPYGSVSGIVPVSDSGFICVGRTTDTHTDTGLIYIFKINAKGDTMWNKTYGTYSANYHDMAIMAEIDGNFLISSTNGFEISLLKINSTGDTLWTKKHKYDNNVTVNKMVADNDGNILIAGTETDSTNHYFMDILKVNPSGDSLLKKRFNNEVAYGIVPDVDGNFIIESMDSQASVFRKITPDGNSIWTKSYDSIGLHANAISSTRDGNFLIVGRSDYSQIMIFKITPNGDILWKTQNVFYLSFSQYTFNAVTQLSNGDFLAVGTEPDCQIHYGCTSYFNFLKIIADRYAFKDQPFTYKIPDVPDSLVAGCKPVKTPSGMTLASDGTISWIPKTDSSYMEHVKFLVPNSQGFADSLSFNIFVNSKSAANKINDHGAYSNRNGNQSEIVINSNNHSSVSFYCNRKNVTLGIYDLRGCLLIRLSVLNNSVIWHGTNASGRPVSQGRYFAKAIDEKTGQVKPFILIR